MKPMVIRYSRRHVLKLVTSLALVAMTSAISLGCDDGAISLQTVAERKIESLDHPKMARNIGWTYLKQTPSLQGETFEHFTKELLSSLGIEFDGISHETLNSMHVRLSEQIRRDFREENVVIMRGWMFSKTEMMLCMLAATLPRNSS